MLYLYCIIRGATSGKPLPLLPVAGVPGGGPPFLVNGSGLAAVVSEVPEQEYGGILLERRLADPDWLNPRARAQEGVMDAILRQGPMVPAAVFSLLASEEQARVYLEEYFDKLDALLDYFDGREEWVVRLLFERSSGASGNALRMVVPIGQSRPLPVPMSLQGNEREQRVISACYEICHTLRMRSSGFATRQLAFQTPGSDPVLILGNWAFLVDRQRHDDFHSAVNRLRAEYSGMGFDARIAGPYPPYSFALAPPTETGFSLPPANSLTVSAQPSLPV